MNPPKPGTIRTPSFLSTEREPLLQLRARYQQDRDLFSRHELVRLRFLRWLYEAGRL